MFSDAGRAVPVGLCPFDATCGAIDEPGCADALFRGGHGGGAELDHDLVGDVRRHLRRGRHPTGEVGFEGTLINVAFPTRLAGDFVHYVWDVGREENFDPFEDTVDAGLPLCVAIGLAEITVSKAVKSMLA